MSRCPVCGKKVTNLVLRKTMHGDKIPPILCLNCYKEYLNEQENQITKKERS